jgi:hypothetical protein
MSAQFSSSLIGLSLTIEASESAAPPSPAAASSNAPALGGDSIQSSNGTQAGSVQLTGDLAALLAAPPAAPSAAPPPASAPAAASAAQKTATPPPSDPQKKFSKVTASSNGDPHETLAGTSTTNGKVDEHWNSMASHSDLLDSDSFGGGYDVSTEAGTPSAKGITTNDKATITTDNGQTSVTMSKDGSYNVTSGGRTVTLKQGQATQLGNGETVTLNADKSLTLAEKNGNGATLDTTLKAWGGGVNVSATGHNVDLGGYLVTQQDNATTQPPATAQAAATAQPAATTEPAAAAAPAASGQPAAAPENSAADQSAAETASVATSASVQEAAATEATDASTDGSNDSSTDGSSQGSSGSQPLTAGATLAASVTNTAPPAQAAAPAKPRDAREHHTSKTAQRPEARGHEGEKHRETGVHDRHRGGSDAEPTVAASQPAATAPAGPAAAPAPASAPASTGGVQVAATVQAGSVELKVDVSVEEEPSTQTIASSGGASSDLS